MQSSVIPQLVLFVFFFCKFHAIKFGSVSISNLESFGLSISMGQGSLGEKKKMDVKIRAFLNIA